MHKKRTLKLNLKEAIEALKDARALIRKESHWAQHDLAVDDSGRSCGVKSKRAVAFCALGAVNRINGPAEKTASVFLREAAFSAMNRPEGYRLTDGDIFAVNDDLGHSATLKMFTSAIQAAKKALADSVR